MNDLRENEVGESTLKEKFAAYKNFSADRESARAEMLKAVAREEEIIKHHQRVIADLKADFTSEWRERKERVRVERDEAAKAELRKGRTAREVLQEVGSLHTHWMQRLADEVRAEQDVEATSSEQSQQAAGEFQVATGQTIPVQWKSHDHKPVHKWLLSEDDQYLKHYGSSRGEWFIADTSDFSFVAGDKALFDATGMLTMAQKMGMLQRLLEGSFKGQLRLSPNLYTD